MGPLPIDPHLPEITSLLRTAGALVISAPPGAGKTTRIPRALFDAGFAKQGEILILEPRRLAARLAAARVAQELGEKIGQTVGYSIRFETVAGPQTRIRFLTEAILARRIIHDPNLEGVSTVILDEFHERHLATDLALAFLKRLRDRIPRLNILVMSATLDAEPIGSYLEDAHLLSVSGSPFGLEIEHEERASDRPLHEKLVSAVSKLSRSGIPGDILVFLPGSFEIRRSAEALQPLAESQGWRILPLHGDLPASEQSRAIAPSDRRKVILATNVAETSITIPGIAAVIDSGLVRVAGHSPWSGFPTLTTMKISKSSAKQRAGRAGRTQAGRVLRLYTQSDFESRPEHETPEIKRADLAETALMLHGAGVRDLSSFNWFEAPSKSAIEAAETLLFKLSALDSTGTITETGIQMLALPMHPRLSRLIIEGKKLNAAADSLTLAALLSERDIRMSTRTHFSRTSRVRAGASESSDLLALLDRFHEAEAAGFLPERILSLELDVGAIHAVHRTQRQLQRLLQIKKSAGGPLSKAMEEALLIATLAAFPDRVAKRRKPGSRELLLAGGGVAMLSPMSAVHIPMFVVAVDAEERRENTPRGPTATMIRLASAIEIEWLAGLFPDAICQKTELMWNERAGRVDESRSTSYYQILLEEKIVPAPPSEQASRILVSKALANQLSDFRDLPALSIFRERLSILSKYFPSENFPHIGDPEINETVEFLCIGKCSLDKLAHVSILDSLKGKLTERQRILIAREAPESFRLKAGRTVKIHYESAKPPWIESRLQDFFGMSKTPTICAGQVPLTIHLLAPNGRAVQVTRDLAGFWQRHYPSIRRELQRRYPRHSWPEI
jgi:ATP-dependent helicase HrpB